MPALGGTRLYNAIGPRLGMMPDTHCTKCDTHAKRCQLLWNEINGSCAWAATLWVVDFRRVQIWAQPMVPVGKRKAGQILPISGAQCANEFLH
ncbi:hypothetical protein [Cupriavidus sp. D39]|uniref:hypothetical protein n=1 Tax=Cupriavidus sp. D39 TaxID=2997877 RepID=UPI00226E13D0|nr:hypothetical protein [Cupriavidus sp. D39]MCY0855615.1 hypothetical protein [Cupriavidus sp. D39]